ncbi:MAG: hypothetical protein KGZ58_05820 [Ignavibacteriales bacterium]|nr:hypothetical protein [Ignavibacteriales bacterium]
MTQADYMPRTEAEFVHWGGNLVSKLPNFAQTLGITNDQIAILTQELDDLRAKIGEATTVKTSLQSLTQLKNETYHRARKHARDISVIAKRNDNYTQAVGEDLGIEAPETPLAKGNPDAAPIFFITSMTDMVRLDWVKEDNDGVVIESKRGTEAAWTRLDKDTISPYEDSRANLQAGVPEKRIYRMRYVVDDKEIGYWSGEQFAIVLIENKSPSA